MKLITRSECLHLTWPGRLLLLVVTLSILLILALRIHPFLAVSEARNAQILVVEGWMPNYAMAEVKQIIDQGNYQQVLISGGPLTPNHHTNKAMTHAHRGAKKLIRLGIPSNKITEVPGPPAINNRTYGSAKAVKKWLKNSGENEPTINVATLGTHAARTRLLYAYAFGDENKIGIISVPNRDYDSGAWWKSSEGIRNVMGETIGWLYSRFVFSPC